MNNDIDYSSPLVQKVVGSGYAQGYKAFGEQEGVDSCPHLQKRNFCGHLRMVSWMTGWQDAFDDYLGNFR